MRIKRTVLLLFLLLPFLLISQQDAETATLKEKWLKRKKDYKIETGMMVQLWSLYTTGQEVYNGELGQYEAVDDRLNVNLRRARFLMKARPYDRLKFNLVFFYDLAGRDVYSASVGGTNPSQPNLGIWDAFFQYQLIKDSEAAWLTGGWFRPQIQRESITSAWSVNSFEKSMSQNYLRRHLVGTGPGRASGLNIGGLLQGEKVGLNYNLGIFNPLFTGGVANTVGRNYAPLIAARTTVYLGEPEMKSYKIGYQGNYLGSRTGLSFDLNATYQGQTDIFEQAWTFGPGFLLNLKKWTFDGEWMWMSRSGGLDAQEFDYLSETGHIRAGYNIELKRFVLEPTGMIMRFQGGATAEEQANAAAVRAFSGAETTYDLGFNLYLDKRNLKVSLHYTWRDGDPGEAGDGATVNQYFSQGGVGAIRRGNWLGLGLNAIF